MDYIKLNQLVAKTHLIKKHINHYGSDPLLAEELTFCLTEIKTKYSAFLNDLLFDIYEDCFEDNEIENLENYLTGEVHVFGDELEQEDLVICIKDSPLRIELYTCDHNYQNIIWSAA